MASEKTSRQLADEQAIEYNARNIDKFCALYSPTIQVFDQSTNKLLFEGAEEFRKRYTERFKDVNLHLTVINKMDLGNFAIDHEHVIGGPAKEMVKVIAIFEAKDNLIQKVWFLR